MTEWDVDKLAWSFNTVGGRQGPHSGMAGVRQIKNKKKIRHSPKSQGQCCHLLFVLPTAFHSHPHPHIPGAQESSGLGEAPPPSSSDRGAAALLGKRCLFWVPSVRFLTLKNCKSRRFILSKKKYFLWQTKGFYQEGKGFSPVCFKFY